MQTLDTILDHRPPIRDWRCFDCDMVHKVRRLSTSDVTDDICAISLGLVTELDVQTCEHFRLKENLI
jgi:hypothetical protein